MTSQNRREDVYQVMSKQPSIARGGGGPAVAADLKRRPTVLMVPDTAACEGTTTICLVFDEVPQSLMSGSGQVIVSVRSNEKIDQVVATPVNRLTFSFTAPDNREGDALAVVFINGTEVASCYLHYRSDTVQLVAGLSQIYLQFLSTVCRYMYTLQTKHQIPSPIPELDRLLSKFFDDKDVTHNIPPKAFEELFDILRHSSTADVVKSKYEFPTLLHLSGEYGLEQLAAKLLDLPGSTRANNVFNRDGRTASELAQNNGHLSLSKALDSSNTVEVRSSLITPASTGKVNTLLPKNLRSGPVPGSDSDYVLPDKLTNPAPEFEDNYAIFQQQQDSTNGGASGTSRKPPPAPCQKFMQRKSVPAIIHESESEPSIPQPRTSEGSFAPPVPRRRESRDSGVNVDGNDAPAPPPTTRRPRPPMTKSETQPDFVYDDEGHYVPGGRNAGTVTQQSLRMSSSEIARQLMKPVHPQPGTKGPSITK